MDQTLLLDRIRRLPVEPNPALVEHAKDRAASVQNRIADQITAFAGSMWFVYIHILWFGSWIIFGVEGYPYGLLTMIVSLEAIFLSTFVMISQNRADDKRQVVANQQWNMVREEDRQNQQLLTLSSQILELTKAIHSYAAGAEQRRAEPTSGGGGAPRATPPASA
jgi:uncharacterized membrane protein